jgi:transcriptional regulator with XRE-family HTH domain
MSTLHELGNVVHARRSEMGLTQARVAMLSGLTRQTVNQVENGTVGDLSLNRVNRLAEVLGLSLAIRDPCARVPAAAGARSSALVRAARSASVSYRQVMAPARLRKILEAGTVAPDDAPYLHALLDDAPISLLASLAEQLRREAGMSRAQTWQHFRQLAHQVLSKRDIWQ